MVFGVLGSSKADAAGDAALIDDLRQRNQTLELQIKCAKDELASRDAKMQALDRKVRRLEERLEHAETESRCSDELIDELQENKTLLEGEMRQLKMDLEQKLTEIDAMEGSIEQLQKEKAAVKGVSSERLVELKAENEKLTAKLEELEGHKSDLQKDVDYIEEDLRNAEEQLDNAEREAREAKRKWMDLEEENEELKGKLKELELKSQNIEKKLDEQEMETFKARHEISELQDQKSEIARQLADMEDLCNQQKENLSNASNLRDEIREMEQSNKKLVEQLKNVQEDRASLQIIHVFSLKSKNDRMKVSEEANKSLKAEVAMLKDLLSKKNDEVKLLEDKCISFANSKTGDAVKDEMMSHLQSTNQELTAIVKDYEVEKEAWEREVQCMKRKLMVLEEDLVRVHALEQKNENLTTSLKDVQDERDRCQNRIQELEISCEHFQADLNELNFDRKRVADLEARLAQSDEQHRKSSVELVEKNKDLNSQLHQAKYDLAKKESDLQKWVKYSRNVEKEKNETVGASNQRTEHLMAENAKLAKKLEENSKELESRKTEAQELRVKVNYLEKQVERGERAEESVSSLKLELERFEKQRVTIVRQVETLTEKNAQLEAKLARGSRQLEASMKTATTQAPYPIERVKSTQSTGSSSERMDQKWQKYSQSLEKLASRNDKLQIDLEDTRHRISLVSKDISKRMQRGEESPYFSKMMHSLKKLSYRNDQLQTDLNEARSRVLSLQDEQSTTAREDASQDSTSLLVERSQTLHQLATRHKDLHLELVKSRNHVIHLQKELSSGKLSTDKVLPRLGQENKMPPTSARPRQVLSHIPQHIQVAANGRHDDVSTIMESCADTSKCSI